MDDHAEIEKILGKVASYYGGVVGTDVSEAKKEIAEYVGREVAKAREELLDRLANADLPEYDNGEVPEAHKRLDWIFNEMDEVRREISLSGSGEGK